MKVLELKDVVLLLREEIKRAGVRRHSPKRLASIEPH